MVVLQVLSTLKLGSCSFRGSLTLSPGAWAFICPFQALALQKMLIVTEVNSSAQSTLMLHETCLDFLWDLTIGHISVPLLLRN